MSDNVDMRQMAQDLAVAYGGEILAKTFFDREDHEEVSADLAHLETIVRGLVRNHDSLADDVNPKYRIKGKRGRVAKAKSVPTTTEDILKALTS